MKKLFYTLLFSTLFMLLISTNSYASKVPLNDSIGAYSFMEKYNYWMNRMKLPYRIVSLSQSNEENNDTYILSTNIGEPNDNFFVITANHAGYIQSIEIYYNIRFIDADRQNFSKVFKREIVETFFSIGADPEYKHEADEMVRAIKGIVITTNNTTSFWSTKTGRRYILTSYNAYKNNYKYYIIKISAVNT